MSPQHFPVTSPRRVIKQALLVYLVMLGAGLGVALLRQAVDHDVTLVDCLIIVGLSTAAWVLMVILLLHDQGRADQSEHGAVALTAVVLPAAWIGFIAMFLVPAIVAGELRDWQIGVAVAMLAVLANVTYRRAQRAAYYDRVDADSNREV